jgi:hypothetical protein
LCFHQLHQIQHKKNLQTYAPVPCTILHCCSMQHHSNWFSWISSSDERWTTPIKDQPNFWTIQLYGNIVAHCEKIVFVFVFDMIHWLFWML